MIFPCLWLKSEGPCLTINFSMWHTYAFSCLCACLHLKYVETAFTGTCAILIFIQYIHHQFSYNWHCLVWFCLELSKLPVKSSIFQHMTWVGTMYWMVFTLTSDMRLFLRLIFFYLHQCLIYISSLYFRYSKPIANTWNTQDLKLLCYKNAHLNMIWMLSFLLFYISL